MAQLTIEDAFQAATRHHQAGQLPQAEALYRQILAQQPNHAHTLHLLGVVAHQVGRNDIALDLIRQAIALAPTLAQAHSNLGEVLKALGQPEDAITAYRQAIALQPNFPEAHNNLGNALAAKGPLAEAIAAYREAITLKPDYPEAHGNLGNALRAKGNLPEAITTYRRSAALNPTRPEIYYQLGNALQESTQLEAAIVSYRQAIALNPNYPEAFLSLGNVLQAKGHLDDAVASYRHAIAVKANYPEAHNNLGAALREIGHSGEAIASFAQAIALRPNFPEAYNNLGSALKESGQLDAAVAACRQAITLRPNFPEAHGNLGNFLKDMGRLDEAIAAYRQAIALKPNFPGAQANLLYMLHFHPDYDNRALAVEHRRWYEQYALPLLEAKVHENDRTPQRRLRIGYVSPDFYKQAQSFFVVPLFEHHDHEQFEIHAYASVMGPDEITRRLRRCTDQWHDVCGWTDANVAEKIRADRIDIVVDLTMHMGGSRILLLARQPAPVQVTWLAYPGSSGLPAIDYRVTDSSMEPPGIDTSYSAERLQRLPDSWCCYDPLFAAPECGPLPALAAGVVTFASLNNPCKHNEAVVRLWAKVLHRVSNSRLLLLCAEGSARERMLGLFSREGVPPERIAFVGAQPRNEYLRTYDQIDICLDPFPYNGHTTTCDALWMGVPVLTLPGNSPASRLGVSLLTAAGLAELVAESDEQFVELAAEKSRELETLAQLRAELRARMQVSPLMDAPRFARNIESSYRGFWREWCEHRSAPSSAD